MTLSDVRKFRNKEKEMRIEDLTEYAYTVSEKTLNNSGEKSIIYELDAPITDYENIEMKRTEKLLRSQLITIRCR